MQGRGSNRANNRSSTGAVCKFSWMQDWRRLLREMTKDCFLCVSCVIPHLSLSLSLSHTHTQAIHTLTHTHTHTHKPHTHYNSYKDTVIYLSSEAFPRLHHAYRDELRHVALPRAPLEDPHLPLHKQQILRRYEGAMKAL